MDRFARLCAAVVARLPFGLSRVVAPSLIGFGLINGCTFGVDLVLLSVFGRALGWPAPVAITVAYAIAFGLSFVLNRVFNFRSHAPVGRQTAIYVVVVVVNYAAILMGVGAGLTALGVDLVLARLIAGACEGVFMYCAMRWVVFGRPAALDQGERAAAGS
ncbi:GtrA family protein [Pseudonocardia sp. CA-107938]|uniref:GtrA family protein n=1 Tax=Pseudonocardia sp. CA-107938 TaxID=3240021 RepID=UPI003D8D8822